MSAMGELVPWYKRNILPAWLPGWLAACLLIAVGFAVAFGLFLDDPHPYCVAAIAGALGFALGIVILSAVAVRYTGPRPNPIAPPAVISYPVMTIAAVILPLGWVTDRRIERAATRGGGTIVAGDVAEVFGLLLLFVIMVGLLMLVIQRRRAGKLHSSAMLSLGVAVAAFGYAIVRVVQYHAG
jgi:hypothetical protein